jgi:hypothetical protein
MSALEFDSFYVIFSYSIQLQNRQVYSYLDFGQILFDFDLFVEIKKKLNKCSVNDYDFILILFHTLMQRKLKFE